MIEIAKLKKMVQAELAADAWWDGLSKKEQQAYIKAHPKSKYAKNAGASSSVDPGSSSSIRPIHGLLKKQGLTHAREFAVQDGKKFKHVHRFYNDYGKLHFGKLHKSLLKQGFKYTSKHPSPDKTKLSEWDGADPRGYEYQKGNHKVEVDDEGNVQHTVHGSRLSDTPANTKANKMWRD